MASFFKRSFVNLKSLPWMKQCGSWPMIFVIAALIVLLWPINEEEEDKMVPFKQMNIQQNAPHKRRLGVWKHKAQRVKRTLNRNVDLPDQDNNSRNQLHNNGQLQKTKKSRKKLFKVKRHLQPSNENRESNPNKQSSEELFQKQDLHKEDDVTPQTAIDIAIIACESPTKPPFAPQIEMFNVLLKSLLLLSSRKIRCIIVVDQQRTFDKLLVSTETWIKPYEPRIRIEMRTIWYPDGKRRKQFHKICHLCAMARLFLPRVLHDLDKVIYLDTDLLFLQPVDLLWNQFQHFNSSTIMAVAQYTTKYYEGNARRHKLPHADAGYYNAGIQLVHLKNLRTLSPSWEDTVIGIFDEFGGRKGLKTCDQDIINIFIGRQPASYSVLSCNWNFRRFTCPRKQCDLLWTSGINAIHGVLKWFSENGTVAHRLWDVFRQFPKPPLLQQRLVAIANDFEKEESHQCKKSKKFKKGVLFLPFKRAIEKGLYLN